MLKEIRKLTLTEQTQQLNHALLSIFSDRDILPIYMKLYQHEHVCLLYQLSWKVWLKECACVYKNTFLQRKHVIE